MNIVSSVVIRYVSDNETLVLGETKTIEVELIFCLKTKKLLLNKHEQLLRLAKYLKLHSMRNHHHGTFKYVESLRRKTKWQRPNSVLPALLNRCKGVSQKFSVLRFGKKCIEIFVISGLTFWILRFLNSCT